MESGSTLPITSSTSNTNSTQPPTIHPSNGSSSTDSTPASWPNYTHTSEQHNQLNQPINVLQPGNAGLNFMQNPQMLHQPSTRWFSWNVRLRRGIVKFRVEKQFLVFFFNFWGQSESFVSNWLIWSTIGFMPPAFRDAIFGHFQPYLAISVTFF